MHARVVLGVGKGVLFREVSSVQECPHRERERFHFTPTRERNDVTQPAMYHTHTLSLTHTLSHAQNHELTLDKAGTILIPEEASSVNSKS